MRHHSDNHLIDWLWVVLLALTLGGSWLGESADPGLALALFVAASIAIKGRIIIDHFMELKYANPTLRRLMRLYFYLIPLLILLVYLSHLYNIESPL
ncbi:MAG: cytochrome C oxidase subunit IV family protein [Gammaproteobacteria bacterium]|jgi:hypothetical protein|nr:cytochrome C oxidase subunit IV family protein [Gammaproteobacteria bacterium]MBT7309015.1 cytochrome C oxidase subunit IV family protein [Gammaproteobacteria bacterium]